jgi:hypothetical protein
LGRWTYTEIAQAIPDLSLWNNRRMRSNFNHLSLNSREMSLALDKPAVRSLLGLFGFHQIHESKD